MPRGRALSRPAAASGGGTGVGRARPRAWPDGYRQAPGTAGPGHGDHNRDRRGGNRRGAGQRVPGAARRRGSHGRRCRRCRAVAAGRLRRHPSRHRPPHLRICPGRDPGRDPQRPAAARPGGVHHHRGRAAARLAARGRLRADDVLRCGGAGRERRVADAAAARSVGEHECARAPSWRSARTRSARWQ